LDFPTDKDKILVADFILSCVHQENITVNTKRAYLVALARLSIHVKKSLEEITDLADYVNAFHPDRSEDQDQRWINTQKSLCMPIMKFYKWLAYPDLTPRECKQLGRYKLPPVIRNFVIQNKNSTKSPIKREDIWEDKDVHIFLKYCTENPRLQFYHALAYESSARPGELLKLKIRDISPKPDEQGGKLCPVIEVGRMGRKSKAEP
jgi:integrase